MLPYFFGSLSTRTFGCDSIVCVTVQFVCDSKALIAGEHLMRSQINRIDMI